MIQQSRSQLDTPKNQTQVSTQKPDCSQQVYSQQSKGKNNPNVQPQMINKTCCIHTKDYYLGHKKE